MTSLQTVELFSGTESFSKVAAAFGHKKFSVELDSFFRPDLCLDVLELQREQLPSRIHVLWASCPCTTFSVASLRHYWNNGKPKNAKTWHGISLVLKTLDLIKEIQKDNPDLIWFIENPRGMLRKQDFMQNLPRHTITYCQYGDDRMKPTDIWTNLKGWKPRPTCSPGSPCHAAQPRSYAAKKDLGTVRKGTQGRGGGGKRGSMYRSMIPPALFHELFKIVEQQEPVIPSKERQLSLSQVLGVDLKGGVSFD